MTWDCGILPWYHVHWAKLLDGYVDKYEKVGVFLRFRGFVVFHCVQALCSSSLASPESFRARTTNGAFKTLQTL